MTDRRPLRNYHLDAVRALAALSVLMTHLTSLFFVPYREAGTGVLVGILYVEHYLARGGVICFFALSGYLVGNSVLTSIETGRWSWADYLLRRLTRLQMVLIPALLLTLGLDLLGQWLHPGVYLETANAFNAVNFFGCLVFLQNVALGILPFGSNGPLWSLSYEFWYYVLFPLLALIVLRRKRLPLLLSILAAVIWLTFGQVFFLFACWLGGIAAALLSKRWPIHGPWLRSAMIVTSGLGFVAVMLACGGHWLSVDPADYIFGLFAVLLLWACLSMPLRSPGSLYARGAVFLSEFSYTLYLTHHPVLQFLKAAWLGDGAWKPDLLHVLFAVLPLAAALLLAWLFYLMFESRTDSLRRFLSGLPRRVGVAGVS